MQGQRWVQWPRQMTEWELQPVELVELESELEMRLESRPGAALPSAPSELQQERDVKRSNVLKKSTADRQFSKTGWC